MPASASTSAASRPAASTSSSAGAVTTTAGTISLIASAGSVSVLVAVTAKDAALSFASPGGCHGLALGFRRDTIFLAGYHGAMTGFKVAASVAGGCHGAALGKSLDGGTASAAFVGGIPMDMSSMVVSVTFGFASASTMFLTRHQWATVAWTSRSFMARSVWISAVCPA